ncbi:MAG TPA: hypothetical protein VM934_01560 [Pyrinomonadaceae bacterium]|jgi:hypothetical protein|nr:hypothetical protein [Pyrinomonadaceae bacterium]
MTKRPKNLLPFVLFVALAFAALGLCATRQASAQCALCRTAVEQGGEKTAKTMNLGIVVLLIPPVAIFCSIFAVALKSAKNRDDG